MFISATQGEIKMSMFNHSHYESIKCRNDGSAILDTHGFRIRIRMHIPEQKIVHWIDLFERDRDTQIENKKNH